MLIPRLAPDDPTSRESVVAALVAVGADAVPALVERARYGSVRERAAANAALEQIATPAAVFHTFQLRWSLGYAEPVSR